MLFNSYIFIFLFLPTVLLGFHLIGKRGHHRVAISWLVGASLFFYGWWNPGYLGLILASIIFNYAVGLSLKGSSSKYILIFGIIVNLSLLGYFKYTNFFITNIGRLTDSNIYIDEIILPLAISFFTFQQITYLVDAFRGLTKEYNFLHYCLFVTFFPQLIAGPIVHHKEMLPQFSNDLIYKLKSSNLIIGITIFVLGLFKKVVFADNIALYATPVFSAAESGVALSIFEAWAGSLAYSFQLYFDFSGYSDMAIGLARMFGVVLPINFYSPYKARSIIDFWKRWHITLSRFLRDYLYIPLGGNRNGYLSQYSNLMITMLLGGLWHGAGWTFILWGGMHGVFITINHVWNLLIRKLDLKISNISSISNLAGHFMTLFAVVVAWVMFRSDSLTTAINMYSAMFGFNGISLPISAEFKFGSFAEVSKVLGVTYNGMFNNGVFGDVYIGVSLLIAMSCIVLFAPNTSDLLRDVKPALGANIFIAKAKQKLEWKFNIVSALLLALISIACIFSMTKPSEFLYFQF